MKSLNDYINEGIVGKVKYLKDLILEAKLKSSNDPRNILKYAFAQCVTHYNGRSSVGGYTSAPVGKSGLDGDQLDKVIEAARKCAKYDCEKEKMSQDEINDKINNEKLIYIQPYVYDKSDNDKKGFIGFGIEAKKFNLTLTEGYVVFKERPKNQTKYYLSYRNAILMNEIDFIEVFNEVKWPEDNFTSVSEWAEFEDILNKIYDILK